MSIEIIVKAIEVFTKKNFTRQCNLISLKKDNDQWIALVETTVEDEEMRKYALTPIIGLWEIRLDNEFNITSFERQGLRKFTDLSYNEEKENADV